MIRSRSPNFRSQFVPLLLLLLLLLLRGSESRCRSECDLALASYYVSFDLNLTYISSLFGLTDGKILAYNPRIANKSSIGAGSRIDLGFPCGCIGGGGFLGQVFPYTVRRGDTYRKIAAEAFANLTTVARLAAANSYPPSRIPEGAAINITVICSCGDRAVSNKYGLFVTYPLRAGETLSSVAAENGLAGKEDLLQRYNPSANFSAGEGIVFIPAKDLSGSYRPLPPSTGTVLSGGAIAGIVITGATLLVLAICLYVSMNRRKRTKMSSFLPRQSEYSSFPLANGPTAITDRYLLTSPQGFSVSPHAAITVNKSVEFSYEELSKATNNFSMDNKIGQGGFGSVYYAELRGEKAAIKKMDMQASKEFLAELKVLTHVHHLNLVRLIGYCIEDSLFLVYEYIENGNLSQHLRGSGRDPLPWAARMQIALDSARALEYIHEHTVPLYIHRDIKSTNILIDKNFRGKVADFGLAKLTEVGSTSLQTRLVGTFGYMPPEYARYGDVSAKVDVYAFGVVLYEIISAKEAIVKINESTSDSKGLVILFEEALSKPNPSDDLQKLIDPRLSNNYPVDSVLKIAQLARACTQENPHLRPSMRSIVVALMTLSSTTEDWDVGSLYGNQALANIMYGR